MNFNRVLEPAPSTLVPYPLQPAPPVPTTRSTRMPRKREPDAETAGVELIDGSTYFGQPLPFSITTLIWIEVLVIGYIEFQRNAELDPEKRIYPGGPFDPLNLAADPEKKAVLQLAEIKHARLAMVAFLGFAVQAAATGKGPLNNWVTHLSDPLHTTILDTFGFFS